MWLLQQTWGIKYDPHFVSARTSARLRVLRQDIQQRPTKSTRQSEAPASKANLFDYPEELVETDRAQSSHSQAPSEMLFDEKFSSV